MKRIKKTYLVVFLLSACFYLFANESKQDSTFLVKINIDISSKLGNVNHIWRFFGADEPNYAYMKNGKKLLGAIGELGPGQVFFRTHNLLTTGDGEPALKWGSTNIYTEDKDGQAIYNWHIVDSIFDAYLSNSVRPYVQIGFMPEALSVKPQPYRHHWNPSLKYNEIYTGWAYPPNDYKKWEELVYWWTRHCVEKYGKNEVENWYWETWNEPNISYWQGTDEEFFRLHDHAVNGVLRALPTAKVGGPDVAGGISNNGVAGLFEKFIEHCLYGTNYATGEKGTQLDFISFHAKGSPVYVNDHVRMNIGRQLKVINHYFGIIQNIPEICDLPVIIGESDPEGCAACQGEQLGYRNGTMYSSYTASSFIRKLDLADKYKINLEGALTWAFEFENQPWFAGFRSLATNGINKPVYNVFKMFSRMQGERVKVQSDGAIPIESILENSIREKPDVSAYASYDSNKIYIMVWHYHDDDIQGPKASVNFSLKNIPGVAKSAEMDVYLINEDHSNSYSVWKKMGRPQNPTDIMYEKLEESSNLELVSGKKQLKVEKNQLQIDFQLDRQAVALLEIRLNEK